MFGQAVMAAGHDVPQDRKLHVLHVTFVGPGNPQAEIEFSVETLKAGASFSQCHVTARQEGRVLMVATASFHVEESTESFLETESLPSQPDACCGEREFLAGFPPPEALNGATENSFFADLIERRSQDWADPLEPGTLPPLAGIWCRYRENLAGASDLVNKALLAYLSDLEILYASMRRRGIGMRDPRTASATLNHAMWFHAPLPADQWLYYDLEGRGVNNNVGLGLGGMHSADGTLAVTVAQQGIVRFKQR